MRPLHGPDAIILDYLLQVAAIAERRGIGTRADVHRVANTWLQARTIRTTPDQIPAPPPPKKYTPRPAKTGGYPIPDGPPRTIELTPRLATILKEMRAGHDRIQIAANLNISESTATNSMTLVARAIGGADRAHALKLVEAGAVKIHIKGQAA